MDVRARNGQDRGALGKDGARAYIGSMLPGFPTSSWYMANTNIFGGFQIIDLLEWKSVSHSMHRGLIERQKNAVDIQSDAYGDSTTSWIARSGA